MNLPDNRELRTITLKDNTILELEYLGSGATCVCYKIIKPIKYEGQVLKVFSPVDRYGRPLDPKSEQFKILNSKFSNMINPVFAIKKCFINKNLTNFITYDEEELIDDNVVFRGKLAVGGETLKDHWKAQAGKALDEQLEDLLLCIKSSLQDLTIYHTNTFDKYKYGILNADFKPSNLYYAHISGPENYIITNLDFGSCVNIADIIDELYTIKDITDGNIVQNKIQEIKRTYIASTPNYYRVESADSDVDRVLKKCHSILSEISNKDNAYTEAAKYIKLLDLKAVLIVFFERLWEIVGVSNNNNNKFKKLWEKLINSSNSLKFEKTYSDGDGNLLVRYNFVQKLKILEYIKENLCRFIFISKKLEEKMNSLTAKKLEEEINSLYTCFKKNDSLNKNLQELNRNEFSDLCTNDILTSKALWQPIGELLEDLLYED